jgi:hypothetical protein
MLPATPQSCSPLEPVARNGLSLARNGCSLSEASIPGSKVLACYFATSRLVSLPGPPSAPLPPLVCPSRWQLLCFRPVAVLLAGSLSCFLCLHSPPGLLHPSGSKRSTDSAALRLAFRIRPISSRSPPPSISSVGCGSPFLVRYVSGGLLFLKPLGTFFNMILSPFFVNRFPVLPNTISTTFIWLVSNRLQGEPGALTVDKTRICLPVFAILAGCDDWWCGQVLLATLSFPCPPWNRSAATIWKFGYRRQMFP